MLEQRIRRLPAVVAARAVPAAVLLVVPVPVAAVVLDLVVLAVVLAEAEDIKKRSTLQFPEECFSSCLGTTKCLRFKFSFGVFV